MPDQTDMFQKLIRAGHRRITNAWPGKRLRSRLAAPIATISFDDFPHSAWTEGGRILEDFGVHGTYFVSAAFSPSRLRQHQASGSIDDVRYYELDDVISANQRGHEIGCHTYGHINTPKLSNVELERSIQLNAEFVKDLIGDTKMTSFAFPQGAVNIRTKQMLSRHFAACRGTWPGINHDAIDLALLKSIALDSAFEQFSNLPALLAEAKRTNAWLIFYGHDVATSPSPWGSTPAALERLLLALTKVGIEVVTMREGTERLRSASLE